MRLQEITSNLPVLEDIIIEKHKNIVKYETEKEDEIVPCIGVGLLNHEDVAVQDVKMIKDSNFPEHCHHANEYLIIYSGKLRVKVEGKDWVELGPADSIYISREKLHKAVALEDTGIIGITIPRDGGYPDAGESS